MSRPFVVLKFGGTSVARAQAWPTIATRMREHLAEGKRPLVVCSALAGSTDAIEALLQTAEASGDVGPAVDTLAETHREFARELGVDSAPLEGPLKQLAQWARGASLLGEVSPRVRARMLAMGELMLTRLGAMWLAKQGLNVHWLDAREVLLAAGEGPPARRLLSATVPPAPDRALRMQLQAHDAVITQGFIARDPSGDTCLLGRGGSDTSAAVFAAKLEAVGCEIWTDVPGMFTADPRKLPGARLLRSLDYAEALEIATTGAKVLHPRALAPVRDAQIPLEIRCTQQPHLTGTQITSNAPSGPAQVKALSSRKGLVLVSMETLGMWQQVGFLAEAFAVFSRHGISVDTVSTSETNVTVSVDPSANALGPNTLEDLIHDLSPYCQARLIAPCASVSLVGRGIRSILHRLAPALELFEEQRVHLVSQAASDLNLTFVVDEDTADRLLAKLHALLFAHRGTDQHLGPTWRELFSPTPVALAPATAPWWESKRAALIEEAQRGTPAYVYDAATLRQQARSLMALKSVDVVLYAMKANSHPAILALLAEEGLGFECVSPGELARVAESVSHPVRTLFTPNFASREELAAPLAPHIMLTLDNLHPLEACPELFAGRELFVRVDPDRGRGHHAKVRTAGSRSKFGVGSGQLDEMARRLADVGARVVGLHAHVGSGVLDAEAWQDTALFLASVAERFPDVKVLDLGGGLGVPDRPGRAGLDLVALDQALQAVKTAHPHLELWLEPGRFLVAEAGVLLTRVTQLKQKGDVHYVGVDAGMHTLIRPALYGAYHHVANLTRHDEPLANSVTVVGPICETGDILARDRRLPDSQESDVLLVATAGAYGAVMASGYNLRAAPSRGPP